MSDKNIVSQTFNTGESSNFEALALNVQKYAPKNVNITSTTGAVSGDVVFEFSTPKDVPYLEEGQVCILNKDTHWTATYKKQGKLYEIDSFNRDLLGSKYHDAKVPKSFVQPPFNTDCGQRAMSELIVSYFSKK